MLFGIGAIALILIFMIVLLDQQAMKNGKMGLWESMTDVVIAKSEDEVDTQITKVLKTFDITKRNLIQVGKSPSAYGDQLIHKIYRISDKILWLRLSKRLETDLEKSGVKTHNRFFQSEPISFDMLYILARHSSGLIK